MKKIILILSIIYFAISACVREVTDTETEKTEEYEEWIAPNASNLKNTLRMGMNTAISETENMGLSNFKNYIQNIGNRFSQALKETEKTTNSYASFSENINNVITLLNENIESTKGIRAGFSKEQNESLKKYLTYSLTAKEEAESLLE